MSKTASNIVDRALTLIDETPTTFTTAATTETSIREQALDILPEVCRDLVKELPWGLKRYLAEEGDALTTAVVAEGEVQTDYFKQMVIFSAPDDFLELVSIQLGVWAKPVTEYILVDSPEYKTQKNPFTRAGRRNPVVALGVDQSDQATNPGRAIRLECYSIQKGDSSELTRLLYIPFDNVPDDAGNTWPDELFDVTAKALAAQLLLIKSGYDGAKVKSQEITDSIEQQE